MDDETKLRVSALAQFDQCDMEVQALWQGFSPAAKEALLDYLVELQKHDDVLDRVVALLALWAMGQMYKRDLQLEPDAEDE